MDAFTLVLLVMLGFAVLLVAGIGRKRVEGAGRRPILPRVVAGGATVGAILAAVGGIVGAALTSVSDRVTLTVPVAAEIEIPPEELRSSTASIVSGAVSMSDAVVTVSGLDVATRTWLAAGILTNAIIAVTVLFVIAKLARQSMAGAPFADKLHRLLIIAGATLGLGSILAQVFLATAGSLARSQLFSLEGQPPIPAGGFDIGLGPWVVELWPVGVGLVLIVAARLIRSAERLQRDTAGLV